MTEVQKNFMERIASAVIKIAPEFGIMIFSPIIAQAILESGWGTSNKAKHNNFFGLKYREGRVTCHSGTFVDGSSEQNADGSYIKITDQWYEFATLEDGVRGYFQFINISRYRNLKGVTDWEEYIRLIREDGYATSLSYIQNLTNVIKNNNLTKFDKQEEKTMNIINSIMTKNPCYTAGRKITVKGLMLHSVGCSQPSAMAFINNWNRESYDRACVHGFIDANTGDVYQTLPWNHRGWHGGGSSNNTHIGVEMCEPDCIKYTGGSSFTCSDKTKAIEMVKRTYNSAVELYAYLCKKFNLNPLTDICSHSEGYKKGIASNHGDPEHLWRGLGLPYTMDTFRADVKSKMTGTVVKPEEPKKEEQSVSKPSENKNFPSVPFMVRVIVSDLNIRKEAKMGDNIVGQTGKGTFTITAVNDGWGKLKGGAGWIYLENPEYVTIKGTVASSTSTKKPVTPSKKSNEEIAKEVIAGKWGNGQTRKDKLKAAGYDYATVQAIVDKLLNKSTVPAKKSNETIAKEVLQGKWGNGSERKKKIEAAGYNYSAIQAIVNKLCK